MSTGAPDKVRGRSAICCSTHTHTHTHTQLSVAALSLSHSYLLQLSLSHTAICCRSHTRTQLFVAALSHTLKQDLGRAGTAKSTQRSSNTL